MAKTNSDTLACAISFASALDRCDFDEAGPYLCDECVYMMGPGRTVGRAAIVNSYRDNAAWASEVLSEVVYESDVRQLPDGRCEIAFTDHIFHGGQKHAYRCCQILSFDGDGLIAQIEHVELPDEREKLDVYFKRCRIDRSSS